MTPRLSRIARGVSQKPRCLHAVRSLELGCSTVPSACWWSHQHYELFSSQRTQQSARTRVCGSAKRPDCLWLLATMECRSFQLQPLDYDAALMECQDSVECYLREGCLVRHVMIRGRKDAWRACPRYRGSAQSLSVSFCPRTRSPKSERIVEVGSRCRDRDSGRARSSTPRQSLARDGATPQRDSLNETTSCDRR